MSYDFLRMFFTLAIISMLGYALQNALLVGYARRIDGLSLSFYRNISFAVTLLPLLAFSSRESIGAMLALWPTLLVAGAAGTLSLALRFASYRFIPVGVGHSFTRVVSAILLTAIGWFAFGEYLEPTTLAVIGLLLFAVLWLGLQRNHMPHLNNRTLEGIGLAVLAALPLALTVFLHVRLSRDIDPYAASYCWEVAIGVTTLAVIGCRRLATGTPFERVPLRTFCGIAAASSPTLLGTGGVALAVRYGPVGVVSAIASASLVVTALLAWWLYGERLTRMQWMAVGMIAAGMMLLKLFGL